jgi:hypothetical protein
MIHSILFLIALHLASFAATNAQDIFLPLFSNPGSEKAVLSSVDLNQERTDKFLLKSQTAPLQKSSFYAGSNIPLFYSMGYDYRFIDKASFDIQLGLLATPYDKVILKVLEVFDTDEMLVNTIGEAFSVGYNFQPSVRWHFGKYHLGIYYSYLMLHANESPASAMENYYGVSIPDPQYRELSLHSNLHSGGLVFGREFQFNNPAFRLNLELSAAKTFASQSLLKGKDGRTLKYMSELIHTELSIYYTDYGYLPSVNVFFTYTLPGRKKN